MSLTVCLFGNTLTYPEGGGHLWVYLNWALGLRALGCKVIWLEGSKPELPADARRSLVATLRSRLAGYGIDDLALCSLTASPLPPESFDVALGLDAAVGADLLLNFVYGAPDAVIGSFRRSALVDIDPGLLQFWLNRGWIRVAGHDTYFTISETVGQDKTRVPDEGIRWHHTPPCVALEWWPVCAAPSDAAFTTVSNWYTGGEWMEDENGIYANDKRDGFLPFLDLPRHMSQPLELALCMSLDEVEDRRMLEAHGWRISHAEEVASSPASYQRYVQASRGEFSCAKPAYVLRQTAWISDRTLCYLASGKPAIVQHTGQSRFLPDAAGLFRFRDLSEAARYLEMAEADYAQQCRLARCLAEEYFDARKVVRRVLERALA